MSGLYDEDGIDGPFVRGMARKPAKPRMGRPRLSEAGASRNLTVRVGPEHEVEVEALAAEHGSISEAVRAWLERSAEERSTRAG